MAASPSVFNPFSEEPFPIQSLLLDLESTDTGYDFIHGYEEDFS